MFDDDCLMSSTVITYAAWRFVLLYELDYCNDEV